MNIQDMVNSLFAEFSKLGFDVKKVIRMEDYQNPRAVRMMEEMLRWTKQYLKTPDRQKMEKIGYTFPPVEPDCDPESDWLKFENWMHHKRTSFKITEAIVPASCRDDWTDEDYSREMEKTANFLYQHHIVLEFNENIPDRLVYEYIEKEFANEEFDFVGEDTFTHLTCNNYCTDCNMLEHCDDGQEFMDLYGDEEQE